ncbi:hypothetical protein [Nonomuraea sp. SYSU D8015]|uniref:hypothetical protein n=1 Tax=Nonomuraea sp. SYSU D8015 TaxID=2593644 RepID=UPI001660582A|nr:hypothetical protein [Nonomuraea sp. SYSU D8015]
MPRVNVTTQKITRAGLNPSLTAPTVDGDIIDTGTTFLYVKNDNAGACTVTVQTPLQVDGLDVSELVVSVPAAGIRLIGPFPKRTFGRPSTPDKDRAYVDYSIQASVTRAVISF